jgi:magnesium chelatase family protein
MGDPEKPCICSGVAIDKYRSRLSGPILDRVDIFIQVPRVKTGELGEKRSGLTSRELKDTVMKAKEMQHIRFSGKRIHSNAEMSNVEIEELASISEDGIKIAISSTEKLKLSTRVYYRILRVARTIADIDSSPSVEVRHILEALSYRGS